MKKVVFVFIWLGILLFVTSLASACTIFTKSGDNQVLVGNNEDWFYSTPVTVRLVRPAEGEYGMICFVIYSFVQGGMNDQGLFFDMAICPQTQVPYSPEKPQFELRDMGERILAQCSNVEEALKMVQVYNPPSNLQDHLLFADKAGNAAVVEWVNNELHIIPKQGNFQVITNFWFSEPKLGGYPCSRYEIATEMLENQNVVSLDNIRVVLEQTSQNWGDGGTVYSNIYDLANGDVYIFNLADFEHPIKFNLADELQKGSHTHTLQSLFPEQ